jgi:hypothetical protein
VLDYRITYDQSIDDYVTLVEFSPARSYTATGLTAGNTYKFKVEARNEFGYSQPSDFVSILCATMPARPAKPTSTVFENQVLIDWSAPSDQGTPIQGYNIYFKKSDGTFATELGDCDGSSEAVIA